MLRGDGSIPAQVMIVGEAPGEQEMREGKPFVGASGAELNKMLHEAGINRPSCFVTNVVQIQPPYNDITRFIPDKKKDIMPAHVPLRDKHVLPCVLAGFENLRKEILLVQPNVIIAMGNVALWALTGIWGITKWRGSQLLTEPAAFGNRQIKVIPTVHPALVLREWAWRGLAVNDLRRAAREQYTPAYSNIPEWRFIIRPSFAQVQSTLLDLFEQLEAPLWLDFDLETKAGHIDCAGLSWSLTEGISIPFMSKTSRAGYWQEAEELWIVWMLSLILRHPNVLVRGQNLLYDCQYTLRHWHFIPRVAQDTMIAHHSAFCGMRKSLDFQASLYCDYYKQWKPDKTAWKEAG